MSIGLTLSQVFLAKMPFFIGYEPKPFSKESFQPGEAEGGDDQLQGENTIRWRFNPMNPVGLCYAFIELEFSCVTAARLTVDAKRVQYSHGALVRRLILTTHWGRVV